MEPLLEQETALYEEQPRRRGRAQPSVAARPARPEPTWADWRPSPNHSSRGRSTVTAIIYHFTAGPSLEGTVRGFQNRAQGRSAHYVIGRDGRIVQMVPLDRAAWHAGRSSLAGRRGVNRFSVGIEIVNWGQLLRRGKRYCARRTQRGCLSWGRCSYPYCTWAGSRYRGALPILARGHPWEPFTDAQYRALIQLTQYLLARFPNITHITGHEDVALPRGRKNDPGGAFDWTRIRAALRPRFRGYIGHLPAGPTAGGRGAREGEEELEQLLEGADEALAESEGQFEWEASYRPSGMVLTICRHAHVRANQLRREVQNARGITNAQHREHQLQRLRQQANFFVRRWANQAIGYIPQLHPNDVDRLVGCLARVEHAVGRTLPGLGPLRRAAGRRLSLP